MLVDAFQAENYRFWKNRMTMLWSVAFVPLMAIVFGTIGNIVLKANAPKLTSDSQLPPEVTQMLAGGTLDIGQALVGSAAQLASPPLLLFVLIGAATIYAGDYRWETWRLISARNSRSNLLLGKVGVVAVLALVALVAAMIANVIVDLIKASVFDRTLAFTMDGQDAGRFGLLTLLSWWRVIQFTLLGLLAATMTRSLLAALFIPIVIGVAGTAAPSILAGMGVMPDSWPSMLMNPGGAIEMIQAWVNPQVGQTLPEGALIKAWTSAGLWTALPLAGALAWFRRQDLSKE
jgi:ABC-2 type transport system permease protein